MSLRTCTYASVLTPVDNHVLARWLERGQADVRDYQNSQLNRTATSVNITEIKRQLAVLGEHLTAMSRENRYCYDRLAQNCRILELHEDLTKTDAPKEVVKTSEVSRALLGISWFFRPEVYKFQVASWLDLDDLAYLSRTCRAARNVNRIVEGLSYFQNITDPKRCIPLRCHSNKSAESADSSTEGCFPLATDFPPNKCLIKCPILGGRTWHDERTTKVLMRYLVIHLRFVLHTHSEDVDIFYPFLDKCREFSSRTGKATKWILQARSLLKKKFEHVTDLFVNRWFLESSSTWGCKDWEDPKGQRRLTPQEMFPNVEHLSVKCMAGMHESIAEWLQKLPHLTTFSLQYWFGPEIHPQFRPLLPQSVTKLNLIDCCLSTNPNNFLVDFAHLTSIDIDNSIKFGDGSLITMCSDGMLMALLKNALDTSSFKLSHLCMGPIDLCEIEDPSLSTALATPRALPMRHLPRLFRDITWASLKRFRDHFGRSLHFEIHLKDKENLDISGVKQSRKVDRWKRVEEFFPQQL